MDGYLGETNVSDEEQFTSMTPSDYALLFIEMYGSIDGDHHKDWVLDQVARILNGVKVIVSQAKWSNGESEYRYRLDEATDVYNAWVKQVITDENGEIVYDYNCGIAP